MIARQEQKPGLYLNTFCLKIRDCCHAELVSASDPSLNDIHYNKKKVRS
jgi:hypothetical protein